MNLISFGYFLEKVDAPCINQLKGISNDSGAIYDLTALMLKISRGHIMQYLFRAGFFQDFFIVE